MSSAALAMQNDLRSLGVPDKAIWLESTSRNTRGNACFSARVLQTHRENEVLLVT